MIQSLTALLGSNYCLVNMYLSINVRFFLLFNNRSVGKFAIR